MSDQDKKEELNIIREHRNFIDKERINLANSLDKYLLTFSTGILSLSVSFISNGSKYIPSCLKTLLAFGWTSLVITIISTLASIFISLKAFEYEITTDDQDINKIKEGKITIIRPNKWDNILDLLQWITILSFIAGIIILSIFYFNNLSQYAKFRY